MFGIAWSELLLIGIVALVVIPPKDLPTAMRAVGKWVGQMRRMAADFQGQVSSALREAEFDDIKKTFKDATSLDAMADIREEIESATRPLTQLEGQFRDDLSIAPEVKSFPAGEASADLGPIPTLEADSATPPGPTDWPGAMTAPVSLEPEIAAPLSEFGTFDPVSAAPDLPRLPAHLRGPDPEPEDPLAESHPNATLPRVSGASS